MKIDNKSMAREKRLKETPFDSYSIADINFLERQWIINWVGASWQWPIVRWILTKLFHFLDSKRHDVSTWKWWTLVDFHKSNYWLLKYSFISLADLYRKLHRKYKRSKFWRSPLFIITTMIKIVLIIYAYRVCDSELWKKAFTFHNK